ncbi:hypothetical protein MPTK1_5g06770 [Marchantia polymorpha subsp. ruderalis]
MPCLRLAPKLAVPHGANSRSALHQKDRSALTRCHYALASPLCHDFLHQLVMPWVGARSASLALVPTKCRSDVAHGASCLPRQ